MVSLTCTYCLYGVLFMEYQQVTGQSSSSLLLIMFSISLHVLCKITDLVLALLVQSNTVRSKLSYAVRFLAKSSSVYEVKMAFLISSCHILG